MVHYFIYTCTNVHIMRKYIIFQTTFKWKIDEEINCIGFVHSHEDRRSVNAYRGKVVYAHENFCKINEHDSAFVDYILAKSKITQEIQIERKTGCCLRSTENDEY